MAQELPAEQGHHPLSTPYPPLPEEWAQLLTQLPAVLLRVNAAGQLEDLRGHGLAWLPPQMASLVGQPLSQLSEVLPGFQVGHHAPQGGMGICEGRLANGSHWQCYLLPQAEGGWLGYLWIQAEPAFPTPDQLPLLSYFIRHAPAAIAMFDRDMRYLMVSDHWMEVYNLTEPVLGRTHYEVFPEIPERWKRAHQRCLSGVIESCEADPFPRQDGRIDYINWVVAPWYQQGEEVGGLIFYTEKVNEQVEARAHLLTLNQALKRSNERLTDFALAVSHTLREPLSLSIAQGQALAHALEQRPDEELLPQVEGWLNHLYRMESIIAGLLANAHIEETPVEHEVDLNEVMREVLANLEPLIQQRGAVIHQGTLPPLRGNEFELIALFQQFIVNAIAYNDRPAPEVIISAQQHPEGWQFCIRDNGLGLDAAQQQSLFSFARQRDLQRVRGHGVGLPVCQRIVHRMGGQLWVESTPGQGTTFSFTLGQPDSAQP